MRDDQPVRARDRLGDRLQVEGDEGARVDHLDLDSLARDLLGCGDRLLDEARERDDGDVAAWSHDPGSADRIEGRA
jgi:hypothetical protein